MASPDASTTNGFVGVFRTPDEGGSIRVRLNTTLPSMAVTEEIIESGGGGVIAIAKLDISSINIQEGTITAVLIERSIDNTNWIAVPTISLSSPITGSSASVTVRVNSVPWAHRGILNYFRAYLLNADGEVAWKYSDGTVPSITTSGTFNGTADVAEYPEVTGLKVANVTLTDGDSYATPAPLPSNGVARLQWDNMMVGDPSGVQNLYVPNYSTGVRTSTAISNAKLQQLDGYVIFMFVCSTAAPTLFCPNNSATDTAKGTWYKLAECSNNFYDVTLPRNKTVAFWVGCKLKTTTNALGSVVVVAD